MSESIRLVGASAGSGPVFASWVLLFVRSVCLSIYLSIYLPTYLPTYLPIYIYIYIHTHPVDTILRRFSSVKCSPIGHCDYPNELAARGSRVSVQPLRSSEVYTSFHKPPMASKSEQIK